MVARAELRRFCADGVRRPYLPQAHRESGGSELRATESAFPLAPVAPSGARGRRLVQRAGAWRYASLAIHRESGGSELRADLPPPRAQPNGVVRQLSHHRCLEAALMCSGRQATVVRAASVAISVAWSMNRSRSRAAHERLSAPAKGRESVGPAAVSSISPLRSGRVAGERRSGEAHAKSAVLNRASICGWTPVRAIYNLRERPRVVDAIRGRKG